MLFKILVGYDNDNRPIYKVFSDPKLANEFIQSFLATEAYSIVAVDKISDGVIELYCDVV